MPPTHRGARAMVIAGVATIAVAVAAACAYPRRTTSLAPATDLGTSNVDYPEHLWRLELVELVVPPRQRSGLPWDDPDDEADGPDPYVRVLRDGKVLFESAPLGNTFQADFDVFVPGNLELPPEARIQIEVWDADRQLVGTDDPVGVWRNQGLPANTVPDGDLRLRMDSGVTIVVRVRHPQPFRGTGVETYEVRDDAFKVIEVIPRSPAGRAGIAPDDRVVAIDGKPIAELGDADAATAFSLAAERRSILTVERDGEARDISLDDGYVWPAR